MKIFDCLKNHASAEFSEMLQIAVAGADGEIAVVEKDFLHTVFCRRPDERIAAADRIHVAQPDVADSRATGIVGKPDHERAVLRLHDEVGKGDVLHRERQRLFRRRRAVRSTGRIELNRRNLRQINRNTGETLLNDQMTEAAIADGVIPAPADTQLETVTRSHGRGVKSCS